MSEEQLPNQNRPYSIDVNYNNHKKNSITVPAEMRHVIASMTEFGKKKQSEGAKKYHNTLIQVSDLIRKFIAQNPGVKNTDDLHVALSLAETKLNEY